MHLESLSDASPTAICPQEFISTLQPSLTNGCVEEVLKNVGSRWKCSQILQLLTHATPDVRKIAALALSVMGDRTAVVPLAMALHDGDCMVSQMAEHALWSIWFRLATPEAVKLVKCGNTHLHHGNYTCAIERFTQAIQADDQFAEAYNQRGIAYYLSERFAESITDCRSTLVRMPQHFGAMAGMGHCHAHLGQWREAKRCYRLALAIHPGFEGIQQALDQVDQVLREVPGV